LRAHEFFIPDPVACCRGLLKSPPHRALDSAQGYGGGSGEQMLGDLGAAQRFTLACAARKYDSAL
jgi:hypothetical protein